MAITKALKEANMTLHSLGKVYVHRVYTITEDGIDLGDVSTIETIVPGDDYSAQPQRVRNVLDAFHTQAVIDAWLASQL